METKNNIDTSKESVLFEDRNGSNLIISFGGGGLRSGTMAFEFVNALNIFDCDKLYLKDFTGSWYQNGIDDKINSFQKVLDLLKERIAAKKYSKIIAIGNSMGAFAAILFGTLLNVNKVIAFAPQTFIDPFNRIIYWDRRLPKSIPGNALRSLKEKKYLDIKAVLKNINYQTEITIFYSVKHRLDKIHSERMKNLKNITLKPLPEGGHGIVKTIRDSGELFEIIKDALK